MCVYVCVCVCVCVRAAGRIGLHIYGLKTKYVSFNQRGDISPLKGSPLELVHKFSYLGIRVSSTENDINMHLAKAWKDIDGLAVIWKSNLIDKVKCSFFQAAVVSILLYGCTTWTLTERFKKKA